MRLETAKILYYELKDWASINYLAKICDHRYQSVVKNLKQIEHLLLKDKSPFKYRCAIYKFKNPRLTFNDFVEEINNQEEAIKWK